MRLLSHNLLMCPRQECHKGYPLLLKLEGGAAAWSRTESDNYTSEFVRAIVPKLDWGGFRAAAAVLDQDLPLTIEASDLTDEDFCQRIFEVAMNLEIHEAQLTCPQCHRSYPVRGGIPNLLVAADDEDGAFGKVEDG